MTPLEIQNTAVNLQRSMDLPTANAFARALPRVDTNAVNWKDFQIFEGIASMYRFDQTVTDALALLHESVLPLGTPIQACLSGR